MSADSPETLIDYPMAGVLPAPNAPSARRSGGAAPLLALLGLALFVALAPQRPSATALLSAASQQRAIYRYDQALALYAEARDEAPSDPRPVCAEGDVLALQREPRAAVTAYQTCVALAPDDAGAWLALGDAYAAAWAAGVAANDTLSAAAWEQAARRGSAAAWTRLGARDERLGLLDDAGRDWAQTPPGDALGELAAAHLGMLALSRGDATAARAHFARLTGSTSDLVARMKTAGMFLFDLQPPTLAIDWEGIGHALLAVGEPSLALGPFQRAVALAPGNGSARAYYGYTLWILGQRAAARPEIAAGLVEQPVLPFAYYAAGREAMTDGRDAQALAYLQTALRSDPHNAALWSAAGDAAQAAGQYLAAELSYQNAAKESNSPNATVALARFYLASGLGMDDGTALNAARDGLLRFPGNEQLAFLQGLIYDRLGQPDYALGLFQLAQRLDPTDPGPWLYLGRYAAGSGDTIPAALDLRTALALQPNGPYAGQIRVTLARLPATNL